MAEVKWVKIMTDMFDNRKIKHLRRLPEGNSIVLIWVMLLTMAGRCNAGGMIFLTENIPYTPKMLADELGFEENTVKLALQALEKFNMITTDNACFTVAGWNEYQNIEGMDKIREQTNRRVAAYRQRQKELAKALPAGNATCNVTVTDCNATDKDKEEDKETEREEEHIYAPVIAHLNEKAGTNYKATTKKTQALIRARMSEGFTLEDFKVVIDRKCTEWMGSDMEKYLRPETLFGTKFEGYLNTGGRKETKHNGSTQNNYRAMGETVGTYL